MAKKRLGTNLNALLGGANLSASVSDDLSMPEAAVSHSSGNSSGNSLDKELREVPVEFVVRGKYQPRRDMHPDALEELAGKHQGSGHYAANSGASVV